MTKSDRAAPLLPPAKPGEIPALAIRPRAAAKALGISERTLWTLTNRGEVPHLRMGRAVLYSVDGLRTWLTQQSERGGKP